MSRSEVDFDQRMIDQLSDIIPPEEEIRKTNPWSKPIGSIIWGLILTTLHLNFLYLQYILPTIGVILIFLGFRSLRNENRYFKVLWLFSIVKLFLHLANLVWVTTPLNRVDYPELAVGSAMFIFQTVMFLIFQVMMFLIFQAALNKTYKKLQKPIKNYPLLWAALWSVAAFLIALSPLSNSWLVFIPMIICYILIIRSLFSIGEQLDDTGYALSNAPVKINNRTFGWAYFLITLTTFIICSVVSNHLPLESREYHLPDITEARQRLLSMEFPDEALQYLNDQDVTMLSDAINVQVFNKQLMFDPKRVEHREQSEGHTYITHTYEPGKKNLENTTVFIEMPDNVVYVMQYFRWLGGKPVWQDGILISGETKAEDKLIISSGLFYSQNGVRYVADFPRLICDKITQETWFGLNHSVLITGALSYPFGSEGQGGYVLYRYTVKTDSSAYVTHALFNYVHQVSPVHIPYARTEDQILSGAYTFVDELQQHFTTYESLAFRELNQQ